MFWQIENFKINLETNINTLIKEIKEKQNVNYITNKKVEQIEQVSQNNNI